MSEDKRTPAQIARANYDHQAQETPIPAMSELQEKLNAWMGRNFGFQEDVRMALGAAEEVGELAEVLLEVGSPGDMRLALGATKAVGKIAHAALKRAQKIRGFDDKTKYLDALADAIADINIYLMNLASANRLDYGTLIAKTAEKVMQRDWKAKPVTADVIAETTPSRITVNINGHAEHFVTPTVSYECIVLLAREKGTPAVTWTWNPPSGRRSGMLMPRQDLEIHEGMSIYVRSSIPAGIPIIINGRLHEVRQVSVTYADIITLAGIPFVHNPTVAWSYQHGVHGQQRGTLVPNGPPVALVPDMIFNVTETSNT